MKKIGRPSTFTKEKKEILELIDSQMVAKSPDELTETVTPTRNP